MGLNKEELAQRLLGEGFSELLGVSLEHAEPGMCRIRLPYKPALSRGDELIHGGVIATLIDLAGSAAAWTYADIGHSARGATIGLTVSYLQGASSCDLVAEGRVARRGGTITVIDVEVTTAEGELIAKGPVTYKLSL